MAVNDLAMKGARASTAMVLTLFSQNIPVSAPEGQHSMYHKISHDLLGHFNYDTAQLSVIRILIRAVKYD